MAYEQPRPYDLTPIESRIVNPVTQGIQQQVGKVVLSPIEAQVGGSAVPGRRD